MFYSADEDHDDSITSGEWAEGEYEDDEEEEYEPEADDDFDMSLEYEDQWLDSHYEAQNEIDF